MGEESAEPVKPAESTRPMGMANSLLKNIYSEALNAIQYYNELMGREAERSRKIKEYIKHPPTVEQLVKYELAKIAFEFLKSYPDFYYDEVDLREPMGKQEVVWAETEEEWKARIAGEKI